jgi:hypothetical protein
MSPKQRIYVPQVSIEENNFLTAEYSEEEARKAIFQMENNKAPGSEQSFIKPFGTLSNGTF